MSTAWPNPASYKALNGKTVLKFTMNSTEHTVCFSAEVISSKSESASGTVSGPSLSSGQLLWKCLMKSRGNAANTDTTARMLFPYTSALQTQRWLSLLALLEQKFSCYFHFSYLSELKKKSKTSAAVYLAQYKMQWKQRQRGIQKNFRLAYRQKLLRCIYWNTPTVKH